jgi:hypothetical protein
MVATDIRYFPMDGQYIAIPGTIYAQFDAQCPNPCRKYHVSSEIEGAERVAGLVLPFLASKRIFHKIVQSRRLLSKQEAGNQAGKFITIYLPDYEAHLNTTIKELGTRLLALSQEQNIKPCPRVPKSRGYSHVFIEQPLDKGLFIYGGFICDPAE